MLCQAMSLNFLFYFRKAELNVSAECEKRKICGSTGQMGSSRHGHLGRENRGVCRVPGSNLDIALPIIG